MKSHARVVVIGGGIGGCSTLYHLTEEGLTDTVLVERDELTSGSTWHAAAQVTQFGANQTMVALKRHSIDLYRRLSDDPEFPIDYHVTGGMRLAHTEAQRDTYLHFTGMARSMGVEFEYIDQAEVARRHPLIDTDGLLGAWWDPLDGDIDPTQLTPALARRARQAGAEICRRNPVQDISRRSGGEFCVHTQDGDIVCETLVNASGYRVNEVGRMLGVEHPVVSLEHMYFLTEPIAEIQTLDARVPLIRDPGDDFYCRQEKQGLLVGIYEQNCKPFGLDGIDPRFTQSLCPSDLDRCLDNMDGIFKRLPCLTEAGIHTVVNGPITYSADGAPLIGPIPGVPNAYACLGLRAGIGEGGGHGRILAQLIVHGESEWDAWFLDPRRFTQYANTGYTVQKAVEDYQREFHYLLPREYRPAARQARTTPLYPVLDARGCAWGVVNGWERALFFKPDRDFVDEPGFRFSGTDAVVAAEVAAVSERVGLMEVSGFNRYEISGPGAGAFLDSMICSALPAYDGRVRLCYLLNDNGHVLSEATIVRLGDEHYWYGSAAGAEWHDRDWLNARKPASVSLREMAATHTTLVVAGPRSRELLQSLSPREDWSNVALPWMHARSLLVHDTRVLVMRVSFSGELGYELHVPNEHLYRYWCLLEQAGERFGLAPFGLYATESMRLEKGYRHWKADLICEYNPVEAGLDRFIDLDKPEFVGRRALLEQIENGPRRRFATLTVDCDVAPAHEGDPVYRGERLIGSVTSGGYGYRVGKNIALAYLEPGNAEVGTPLEVELLGLRCPAAVTAPCLYDPRNRRLRS